MNRLVALLLMLVLMLPITGALAQSTSDSGAFNPDEYGVFDWKTLFRRPTDHIGEKYVLEGRVCGMSLVERTEDKGYEHLWLEIIDKGANSEYVLLWIDPLEFNLFEDDWLEIHATITGVGPLSEYSEDHEAFYMHVEAMNVYDQKDGTLIETYVLQE